MIADIVIADVVIAAFLVVGGLFMAVGSFGLIKLDQPMTRLHAPTKITTLGIGGLLMASMVSAFAYGDGSVRELLITGFLFVTAPITAHFIAKAHIHRLMRREELPAPDGDADWAVLHGADPHREGTEATPRR